VIRHWTFFIRPRTAGVLLAAGLAGGCAADGRAPDPAAEAREMAAAAATGTTQVVAQTAETPASSVYGNYLAGHVASSYQDLDRAATFMSEALKQAPRNPELLRRAFLLHASMGDMDRALSLARRMVHTDATHGAATVLRVLAAVRDGEHGQARAILEDLPGHGLSKLVQPMLGAWIALAEGKSPNNVAKLADLGAIDGIDVLQQVHSALIHDLSDRPAKARAGFDKAAANGDGLSLRLAWLAANFYHRAGDPERARGIIDGYLKRNPASTTAELIRERVASEDTPAPLVADAEQGMAEALFNVAGLLNQQGATDLALLYAQLSLYMHQDFAFGRMLLGEILTSQDRAEAAIAAYRDISEDSPFAYVAKLRVASALQGMDKPAEAIGMLKQIADGHPERYEPMYRIGNVHRGEEAFAEAVDAYRVALDRLGETSQQHWSLHYFLGIALERTDQWADAQAQFKRALELQPDQPYVMNYLAYSWVEQKTNLDQAQAMLKRAVDQRPEDGFIVDSMGWVHYRLGHYDKAVRYLERAVELRPTDPVINDHLGDAYWKVGRKREARFQWHRALSLDPDADVKARIETKLDGGLSAVDKAADG